MALVKFMYGNEAQYTSLATKDVDTLYFLLDTGKIYKGDIYLASKEGVNITETQDAAGDTVYTLTVGTDTYSFYSTTAVAAKIAAAITAHNVAATSTVSGHVTLSDAINDTTSTSADGVAATPAAIAAAVAEAENYTDTQIASVAGGMRFKGAVASAAEIQALTDVENGDTYRASAAFTWNNEEVESGDLLIAYVTESGGTTTTTWYVFQANIDGAVTTSSTLTADSIVLGAGGNAVSVLTNGAASTILQMTANGPAWVTPQAAGITDNTTYSFVDGNNGTFTVTPSDTLIPQTVSIGKPATAGTADQVAHTLTIGNQNFDGTADVTVGTTNAVTSGSTDLVTSGAVYDALVWQSLSNS